MNRSAKRMALCRCYVLQPDWWRDDGGNRCPLATKRPGRGGILLGGIPGVPPAEVVILGAGTAGTYAARAFTGLGAHVTVLDKDINALQRISQNGMNLVTMLSTERNIARCSEFCQCSGGSGAGSLDVFAGAGVA